MGAAKTNKNLLILDGHKLNHHKDRVEAWLAGERIAPITVDMALSPACNFRCEFCYGQLQENPRKPLTWPVLQRFLQDAAELGVRGVSLISDGESTLSPHWVDFIRYGKSLGISMAMATNGLLVNRAKAEQVLPCLDYIRVNFSGATPESYARIMGVKPEWFYRVVRNIRQMVELKAQARLSVTIGMQLVLMPHYGPEVLPLTRLAIELGADYFVVKHCSDDEVGSLGVNYSAYEALYPLLKQAEALATAQTQVAVKWSKIKAGNQRSYSRCYGPPFLIQLSGSGLVAPCGMFFGEKYRRFWIGNIAQQSFKKLVQSQRYWDVMGYLAGEQFDARTACGCLCLQSKCNEFLDALKKGNAKLEKPEGNPPLHINFI